MYGELNHCSCTLVRFVCPVYKYKCLIHSWNLDTSLGYLSSFPCQHTDKFGEGSLKDTQKLEFPFSILLAGAIYIGWVDGCGHVHAASSSQEYMYTYIL